MSSKPLNASFEANPLTFMAHKLVITLIGRDRPGLVDRLSSAVAKNGGNWERSRMADLGGQFAGLLEVSVDGSNIESLKNALASIEDLHLAFADAIQDARENDRVFSIDIVGNDHPGIVRDIFHVFAEAGANVEELETSTESAAEHGAPLFRAKAVFSCPGCTQIDVIQSRIEAIAADIMVDATLVSTR